MARDSLFGSGPVPSRPPVLPVYAVLWLAVGCTSAELEYDRMQGTTFPQPEVVAGDNVHFQSIYVQGKLILGVDEDDTGIRPLSGPANPMDPNQYDYITPSEIETLDLSRRMVVHRIPTCKLEVL